MTTLEGGNSNLKGSEESPLPPGFGRPSSHVNRKVCVPGGVGGGSPGFRKGIFRIINSNLGKMPFQC